MASAIGVAEAARVVCASFSLRCASSEATRWASSHIPPLSSPPGARFAPASAISFRVWLETSKQCRRNQSSKFDRASWSAAEGAEEDEERSSSKASRRELNLEAEA